MPKTRSTYWKRKFEANMRRDIASVCALEKMEWKVMVVWECEVAAKDSNGLLERLVDFLDEG